jgi:hypothetical protein
MKTSFRLLVLLAFSLILTACPDNLDNRNTGWQTTPNGEQSSGPAAPEPESNQTDAQEDSVDPE